MKPILITGATGFLGKHLVQQLLVKGEGPLRLLGRTMAVFPVEQLQGDVTNRQDVERAVEGTRAIYHLAGMVSRDNRDADTMRRVHVEGTRNVCDAAKRHGVDRIVVASSSGTIAVSAKPIVHDEESSYKEAEVARWAYYVTKIEQEKLALSYDRVVVINPSLLLGPGDDRNSSTGDIQAFLDGQILSLPPGGLNLVDARDAAA